MAGRPRQRKVSKVLYREIVRAFERARRAGIEKQRIANRTCDCRPLWCKHDHFVFRNRPWLDRAISQYEDGTPYMNHEHARCIVWRLWRLGGITEAERDRFTIEIGHDEPPPTPATMAVFPRAGRAAAEAVADVVCGALPAIGRDGRKRRNLVAALEQYFSGREVDDGPLWQRWQSIATAGGAAK